MRLFDGGDEGGEQCGAGDEVFDEDVLVGSVGTFAYGAHAVEGGDAEGGGEVAVGASAGGGFVEVEADLCGERLSGFEQCDGAGFALHGWAVDATGDLESAVGIGDFEAAEEAVDVGGVAGFGDADVDLGGGLGGDYIGAGSAGDDPDVDGEFSAEVGEAGDGLDEPGEFEDGGVAVVEVDTAVGGDSGDVEGVLADAFAGGFVGEALGGF